MNAQQKLVCAACQEVHKNDRCISSVVMFAIGLIVGFALGAICL